MPRRIAIVGVGEVGAVAAHTLLRGSCYDELLLVDTNLTKRDGQVCDLSDATYCENITTHIQAATHKEAGQCDMIVVAAGSKRRRGKATAFMGSTCC
jgi:L-lactate dehydrogenase